MCGLATQARPSGFLCIKKSVSSYLMVPRSPLQKSAIVSINNKEQFLSRSIAVKGLIRDLGLYGKAEECAKRMVGGGVPEDYEEDLSS